MWGRLKTLVELEALGADYNGFANDSSTAYQLSKMLAVDSEFLHMSKTNIKPKLNHVLEVISNELEKHDEILPSYS